MRVVLIHNIPSPYRLPLFERLARHPAMDFFVYFLASTTKERKWQPKLSGSFDYKLLPGFTLGYPGWVFHTFHINPTVIMELLRRPYDVIIIGGFYSLAAWVGIVISKVRRKRIILWIGNTLQDEPSLLRRIVLPLTRLLVKFADAFIVYGTRAKEYVMSFGIPPEKIFIAINVGDVDYFGQESLKLAAQKEAIKNELGIKSNKVILYIGQLTERKGVKYLLEAFNLLREEDVGLVIVGDGPQKQALLRNSGKNVYFIDFVQPEVLPRYYAIADIFVLPSLYDRFSIAVSEAMASGLSIVTTNRDGASVDLVRDGVNGYVIEDRNANELRETLAKVLGDSELLAKMRENSRRMMKEEFNLDKTVRGFFEAIEYVAGRRNQ